MTIFFTLTRKLFEVTYPEAKKWIEEGRVFILPVGSTEQHGSAGPLGTDAMAAEVVAIRLADELGGVVLPTICIGPSGYHMKFPGTLSVRPEIMTEYLKDVMRSLVKHGVKKIILCNGHEGNMVPANQAALAIQAESDTDVFISNYWFFVYDQLGKEWEGHFGKSEIAMAMAYNPRLVDMSKATDASDFETSFKAHYRSRGKDGIWFTREFTEIAPTGWYAHPEAWKTTQKDADFLVEWVTVKIIEKMKDTGFMKKNGVVAN